MSFPRFACTFRRLIRTLFINGSTHFKADVKKLTKLLENMIFHKFNIVQYCTFTVHQYYLYNINPLRTKLYLSDLKTQFVPRSKHCLGNKNQSVKILNAELNPICHLLALLGAHNIVHVSWLTFWRRNYFLNFNTPVHKM